MEADWSVEIGPGLPEIHVPWEGFIDLRQAPAMLLAIPEAGGSPALARALARLNGENSPVFTAKSDVWTVTDEIDPYEFSALPEEARCGKASYLDVIERDAVNRASFDFHENYARRLVEELRGYSISNGRVDLVIRRVTVDRREGYGITLYAAGCGIDAGQASAHWEAVLAAAVLATIDAAGYSPLPAPPSGE